MIEMRFDEPWQGGSSPVSLLYEPQFVGVTLQFDELQQVSSKRTSPISLYFGFDGEELLFDEPWRGGSSPVELFFDGSGPVEPPVEPTPQVLGINVGINWSIGQFIEQQIAINSHSSKVGQRTIISSSGTSHRENAHIAWHAEPTVQQCLSQAWAVKTAVMRRVSVRWPIPVAHRSNTAPGWFTGATRREQTALRWRNNKALRCSPMQRSTTGHPQQRKYQLSWQGEATRTSHYIKWGFPGPKYICTNKWADMAPKSPVTLEFDEPQTEQQSPIELSFDELPMVCHWDNGGGFIPGNPVLPSIDLKIPIEPQIRRSYLMQPQLSCIRVSDSLPVVLKSVSISKSRGQWTSSGSLTFSSRIDAERAANELLKLSINGYEFYLLCEATSESRRFGQSSYSASCRGRFAELSVPYKKSVNYVNTAARSFMGLMGDIIENMGWTLVSAITDYNVPAGAFSYAAKTPAEAVNMMANAIGAMLDIDDETKTVTVIPKWPTVPWDVANAVPDMILHDSVILEFTEKREIRTNANAVFVRGEQQGVAVKVKRTGTAGEEFATDVVDKLITDNQAGRMRGTAALADAGNKVQNTLRTKIMADLPPMRPGMLIGVTKGGTVFKSVCDAITISASVNEATGVITVNQNAILLRNEVAV